MDPSAWGWSYPPGPGGPPPPLPPANANPPLPPDQPLPPLPVTGDAAIDTKKSIPDLTSNPPPSNNFYGGAAADWQQNYGSWNQNAFPTWGGPPNNNWPGYGPSPWNNAPPPTGQDPNSYAWNQYWNNPSQAPPQVPLQAPPQAPPPPGPPPTKDSNANQKDETEFDESKDPELIEFDAQFKTWEQQFEKWREDNKDHPDKSALTKYEETWTKWRDELLTKRKEIKKTKLEQFKSSNTTTPKGQKTETTAATNDQPQWGQNTPNQAWGSTDTSQHPWGQNASQPPWGPVPGGPWGPTSSNLPGLGPPPENLNQAPPGYNVPNLGPNWSSSGPNQGWGPSAPNQGQGWGPNGPNQGWGPNGPPGQAPGWGPNGPAQGWGPNGPNQSGPNQAAANSVGPNQGGPNIGQTWGPGGPPPGNENIGNNQSWGPGGPNQGVGWGPPGSNRPPNQGQNWGPNGPNQGSNWGQNSSNWNSNGPNQGPSKQGPSGPNQGSNGPNQGPNGPNQGPNWNSSGSNWGPNQGPNWGSNGPNQSSQSEPPKVALDNDSPNANQGSRPSPSEGNDGPGKSSTSGPPGMTQSTGWNAPSSEKLNSGPSSMSNWGSNQGNQGNSNWGASKDDNKNWMPTSNSSNRPSSGSDSGRDMDSKPNQRQSKWDNGPSGFNQGLDSNKGSPGFNQGDGPSQGNRFNQGGPNRGPQSNQEFNSNQGPDSEWSTDTFKSMDSGKDSGWMGNRGPNRSNNEPQWSGSHRGPGSGFGNRNFSEDESDIDGPGKEGPWNFNKHGDKGHGFGSSDGRFSPEEDDHRNSRWQPNQRFGGPNMGQSNQNFNRNFEHGMRGGPPPNFNRSSSQESNPDFGRMNKRPNMDFQRGNSFDGPDMDVPRRRWPSNQDQDSMMGGRNMQGFGFNSGPDDSRQDHSWGGPNQGRSSKGVAPNQSRQFGRSSLLPNPKAGNFMQHSPPLLPNMEQRGLIKKPLSLEQPKSLMDIPSLLPCPDSKGLLPVPDQAWNKNLGHRWPHNESVPPGSDFRGKGKGGAQSNIKDKGRFSNASKMDGEPTWNTSRKNDNLGSSTQGSSKKDPIKKDNKGVAPPSKAQSSKPNTTVGKNVASKDSTEHKKDLPVPTPKDILLSTQNIDPATTGTPKGTSKVAPSTPKCASLSTPKTESTKSSKDNVTTVASKDKESSEVNKSTPKTVSNSTAKSATGKVDSESGAVKSDPGTATKSPLKSADEAAVKEKPISTQAQARATGNILALFRQRAQEKASGKGAQEGPSGIPGLDLPKEDKESKEATRDSQSSRRGGKFSSRKPSEKNVLPGKDGKIDVKFGENRLNIGPIGVNPNPKTWKPPGEWYDDDEENDFSNASEGDRHGYRKNYGKRNMEDGGSGNSSNKMPRFSDGPGMLPLPAQFAISQGLFGGLLSQMGGPQNFGISQGLLRGPQTGRRQSFLGPRDFGDPGNQRGPPRGGFSGGGPDDLYDMPNRGGNMGNRSRGNPRDGSRGRGGGRGPEALLDMDFASDASFDRNSFFEVGPLGRGINKHSSHERLPFFESEASDANYFGSYDYHTRKTEQHSSKDLPVVKVVDYGHGSISKAVNLDTMNQPNEKYLDYGCTNDERKDNSYSHCPENKDSSCKVKVEPVISQEEQKVVVQQTISINDLISVPGRFMRPPKLVVILRGLPGSGKTTIAKMIKNKEIENGGSAPRILCLDDYFMVESEKLVKDPESGRTVKTKVMEYEFEPELEENYRSALVRSFKKQIDEGFFPFIIIDCVNACVKDYREMCDYAKKNDFEVYIGEVEVEVQTCFQRNVHCRSLKDLQKIFLAWEKSPVEFFCLDLTDYIQDANIQEVKMEDCIEEVTKGEANMDVVDSNEEEEYDKEAETFKVIKELMKSKWDTDQTQGDTLDKLDGVRSAKKRMGKVQPQSIDDWLQLSESFKETKAKPGKKTVRWADIEERREQLSARNRGFVVGQTDWQRMTDPNLGSNALVQIRYIEPREI